MPETWGEIGLWFVTSAIGAGLVKLIDLAVTRYRQKQKRREQKANVILGFLDELAELGEYYRFFAHRSASVIRNDDGEYVVDSSGKRVVDRKTVEPRAEFDEAVKLARKSDLRGMIFQKTVDIRLRSGKIGDLALELEPSGELNDQLNELFVLVLVQMENAVKNKSFRALVECLTEFRETRRETRRNVEELIRK